MKTCPKCGEQVEDNVLMCPICYTTLPRVEKKVEPRQGTQTRTTTAIQRPLENGTKSRKTSFGYGSTASSLSTFYNVCIILTQICQWIYLIGCIIGGVICFFTLGDAWFIGFGVIGGGVVCFVILQLTVIVLDWHHDFYNDYCMLVQKLNEIN